ncbi:MAG TPA: TonB-dependent receptor plug domain-containing protein, partial [Flavitalea sp.]|nr:TonB-dependent receptor plug domain-containing protein [Flavitalea sp.]
MKRILLLFFLFAFSQAKAQNKIITGTVKGADGPISGVSVSVEGTGAGTQTDSNGNFRISAAPNAVLLLSYIGYESKKVKVTNLNEYTITLDNEDKKMQEVVVTALGISREKKSLGYAAQTISGDDVSTVKTGNIVNSLSGKAAGVQIKRNTNMGGSTNIVIRGNKSLTGDNQALFVVDGVPVNNSNFNTSGQQTNGGGFDYGNMASDINPDDVESMTVLKGAAATALYGSRAANGAIIITTKKGAKRNKVSVSLNSGVTVGSIIKSTFPTFQNKYGVG